MRELLMQRWELWGRGQADIGNISVGDAGTGAVRGEGTTMGLGADDAVPRQSIGPATLIIMSHTMLPKTTCAVPQCPPSPIE